MTITELLALYTNPESTDEQKQAALASYEEANKPQEIDDSKLTALEQSIAKLEAKNQELIGEKQAAKTKAEELSRASMTTDELKEDYNLRLKAREDELMGEWSGKYQSVLDQLKMDKVEGQALKLASALSDSPEAILPHIQSRIGFEVGEAGFEVFVKGSDGKRTAATFDELQKEIAETPYLKGVLKSSFTNTGETTVTSEKAIKQVGQSTATQAYLANLNG